ncbi:MAG: RNA polymerase sigma factor [Acidimicrobiales bacterium]
MTESFDDAAGFTDIFERHFDDVYRYLAFRVGEVMAEDLAAETFARAFAGRRRFDPDRGSVRPWLFGIARNVSRDHRRDERRQSEWLRRANAEPLPHGADDAAQLAERLRLLAALASLKTEWREVVLLLGVADLSYEETAVVLHVPLGTVRSRYSRARTQLMATLEEAADVDVAGGGRS